MFPGGVTFPHHHVAQLQVPLGPGDSAGGAYAPWDWVVTKAFGFRESPDCIQFSFPPPKKVTGFDLPCSVVETGESNGSKWVSEEF